MKPSERTEEDRAALVQLNSALAAAQAEAMAEAAAKDAPTQEMAGGGGGLVGWVTRLLGGGAKL